MTNVFFSAMNSEGGEGGGSGNSGSESTGSPQEPNLNNPPTYANETVRLVEKLAARGTPAILHCSGKDQKWRRTSSPNVRS